MRKFTGEEVKVEMKLLGSFMIYKYPPTVAYYINTKLSFIIQIPSCTISHIKLLVRIFSK